ncbi:MAG: ATP-binding protein, partial [Pseudomonadota bacterium]|nr:ATP-binding protein [Pseudomonadota bacterium]
REEARLAAGADGTIASYRVRHRDGHFVWVEVTAKTIRDAAGRVTGWISTTRDISERKRAEQLKADLLATISHDLRTPVMSINGAISLVRRGDFGTFPKDVTRLLEMADVNSKRLMLLISDILDIDKLSAGKMEVAPEVTSVPRLLTDACLANTPYAASKKVSLRVTRCCAAHIHVDAHRMHQILANLLSNAVKYSVPGGEVELCASLRGGSCEILVIDHGSGIPERFRSRLFDRFSQADTADPRARGGAGLGMAIVKELTTLMGGAVSFESQEGQGTTVCVAFPAVSEAIEQAS